MNNFMSAKNRSYIYLCLSALLLLGSLTSSLAQQQCLENLRRARTVYDEGRLHEILDAIGEDCLSNKSDLNEEEKSEAYRLLILSYIYQDLPDKADEAMLALLNENPRFRIDNNTDPNELINLYKTFRTDPIFRYGIMASVNKPLVNIIKTHTVNNALAANGVYTGNISFAFSAFVEKNFLNNKLTLRAQPYYALYKTTYKADGFFKDDDPTTPTTTWEDVENQSWLGIKILARYGFLKNLKIGKKKINPHFILGPSVQYLFNSSLSATTGILGGESASGADLDLVDQQIRSRINISGVAGIGFVVPARKYSIIADITYQYGFSNITDKHTSPEFTFKYGGAMGDMNLSVISLSVGAMFNKYSPKKLTN